MASIIENVFFSKSNMITEQKAVMTYDPISVSRCVDPGDGCRWAQYSSNGPENKERQSSVATSCGNVAT